MENKNRCMMCSYFKVEDGVLPDFGTCTKNNFEVVSSDLACGDFDYALCGKCNNYKPCEFDKHHGYCQKNRGNKVVYGRAICDKFKPKEDQKCCCGTYPFGNDEDKVLKYCANDVVTVAEIAARQKEKELENKIEEYEKMLLDIYSVLHPYRAKVKNLTLEKAFRKLPEEVKAKSEACKNNFDECIRKMNIIDELKAENAKLKEEIEDLKSDIGFKNNETMHEDLKYWKERCHNAEADVTTLNYKIEVLDKRNTNQSIIIGEKGKEIENLTKKNQELQWRNDNQSRIINDLKKERDELKNELNKYKESDDIYFTTTQVNAMVESMKKENGEIKALKDQVGYLERENEMIKEMNSNQFKSLEKLKSEKAKLEKELEIALNKTTALLSEIHGRNEELHRLADNYNELVTNKKEYKDTINALKSQKKYLAKENERLHNQLKYYPTYSALKAEDKIEHLHKQAKKWKNKYKEAYDILQEFFGEHSNLSSVAYEVDVSGDYHTLKLTYDVKINKTRYKSLENARERMKKLD